ncbi:two-component regulator propeller domain-containing protein [Adhaeribacter aquaticus]|uniref:type IX secretion system anionic LPS delivery protein PorZ n=1 Tax=Adhaeribacter aquaticus TaxID=299567 RepID=UPI000420C800|nr:two-component regulator propeller domain-containing protein [Adhaeribacter aquaticus]
MFPKFSLIFFLAAISLKLLPVQAQNQAGSLAIGSWKLHVPNNRAKAVSQVEDKIYCATEDGFFYYDQTYDQLKVLSKADGFSDSNISTLAYDSQTKTLLIAYQNTNIDLVQEDEIINLNDILRKSIPGEKQIHHIFFQDKKAYLACSFGVVVLDLVKKEIKDTYSNLGPNGQVLDIYSTTILNDSIYLATSNGLLAARRSNNNLLDYRNWRTFSIADNLPNAPAQHYRTIAAFNNKVYAGINGLGLYRFNGKTWSPASINLPNKDFQQLKPYLDYLLIVGDEKLLTLNKNNQVQVKYAGLVVNPKDAVPDNNKTFWVADFKNGLVKLDEATAQNFITDAPMYNSAFRLYVDKDKVFVLGGGYDQNYKPQNLQTGFAVYENGLWQSYNPQKFPGTNDFPNIQDLVGAVRNPVNNKLYIASYGYGLLEWEGLGKFKIYNSANSPLLSAEPGNSSTTRIAGIAVDKEGNNWVTNRTQLANAPGLFVLKQDGNWQSFAFPGFSDGSNLEKILIDNQGYKWMSVSRNSTRNQGVLVYNEKKNQFRYLTTLASSGNLPGAEVHALTRDKNGLVWVGTDKGVAVFHEPENVFTHNSFSAVLPLINGRPLLENQVVTSIAVDGANRKWIGTEAGLWYFNEEGDQLLAYFTTQNSPLPSNKIRDIALNHSTGEVFVATDAGLISYRGGATETMGKPECALVFPNPVRPGYTGLLGLSNLPNNAVVKITDIAGNLVYQAKAAGGTMAWDLKDVTGNRVKAGVYLAYSATADGSQSCISKIAVVE